MMGHNSGIANDIIIAKMYSLARSVSLYNYVCTRLQWLLYLYIMVTADVRTMLQLKLVLVEVWNIVEMLYQLTRSS